MNLIAYTGRLSAAPALKSFGETQVAKLVLIRNEYAGKGKPERVTSVQFTAFGSTAEALANNCMKGDQLIINGHIQNNNYEDGQGDKQYGFDFVVDSFEFGAAGPEKREQLDKANKKRK